MVVFKKLQITAVGFIAVFSFLNVVNGLSSGLKGSNTLPGAYIVEFEKNSTAVPISSNSFYSHLESSHVNISPRLALSHTLFNGASFDLLGSHDNESTIGMIKSMGMVKQLWPIRLHDLPANIISTSKTAAAIPSGNSETDSYIPHVMGSVDKLRNEGYLGDGISIAIIDTGVDYLHPALGGGFGPGYKVTYGYDLVGDAYNGLNTPVPDDDPMDCAGHGTHVSGIVGADANNPYSFTGIVPNATLGMYKVFGCNGSVGDDVLIAAFNMAFEAGADLITASIGGNLGWVEDPSDIVASRIVAAGTAFSIAAGNDGANGAFDASNAAEAVGVTAVGSVDSLSEPALLTEASYQTPNDTEGSTFGYSQGDFADFGTASYNLYAITLNSNISNDACDPLPASTPDLSNYIVLIRRGICTFDTKIATVTPFGAKRIMFYNDVPGEPVTPGDTSTTISTAMVSSSLGSTWISLLAAGIPVTLNFPSPANAGFVYEDPLNNLTGGYMSTYSSWGPTYEMFVKPEVSAPGGNILSTYPRAKGSYAVLSGTSMATPFIAGCIALIKQVRGKEITPLEIQTLLATTAKPVDFNDGTAKSYAGLLAPVVQQGGGLVDVFAAATSETILSTSKLAFNDTAHFVKENPFEIRNDGPESATYSFGNLGAATVLALDQGSNIPSTFPPELLQNPAILTFTPDTVTLDPGCTAEIIAVLTPPSDLDATRLPVYSGYVTINGTNGDFLTLPYAGLAASLYDANLTDTADGFPILTNSSDVNNTPISASNSLNASIPCFTIPHDNTSSLVNTTAYPSISWVLAMGSRIVRIDVIPADNSSYSSAPTTEILGVESLGSILGYPSLENARSELVQTNWTGQLDDGSFVPAGEYSLLYRALKIFGDEDNGEDYEAFGTGVFGVEYLYDD